MQDLDNDIIYPFFLDVGRPVVSYVEDLATTVARLGTFIPFFRILLLYL